MEPVRSLSRHAVTELLGHGGDRALLNRVMEHVASAIFAMDLAGRFTWVNRAGAEITGYAVEELTGRPFSILFTPETLPEVMAQFQRAMAGETVSNYEVELVRKDGAHRVVNLNGSPLYENGRVTSVVGMAEDITERRRAEQTLRESEERFRATFERASVGMALVGPQGHFLRVNQHLCDMLGYTREELLQKTFADVTHPDDMARSVAARDMHAEDGTVAYILEKRYLRKDGTPIWAKLNVTAVRNGHGQPGYYIGIIEDITGRKQAQQELEFRNTILSTQQETSLDGILVADGEGKMISFNRRFIEIWGIPPELVASRSDETALRSVLDKVVDPEAFLTRVKYLYEHQHEKSSEEIALKDGRTLERYSASMFGPDGRYHGRVWYFHDITEQKRLALMLAENETRLRTLVQTIPDLIWLKDVDGAYLSCNPVLERFFGASEAEIVGKTDYDFVDKELADFFREHDRKAMAAGKPSVNEEWLTFAEDGRRGLFETIKTPMVDEKGRLVGVLGIARDITGHKRTEDALRDSRASLGRLLNSMEEGVYEVDTHGMCTFVNRAFLQILGYQNADEVLGKHIHELIHHSHPDGSPYPASECRMYRAYQTGQTTNATDEVFWRKDGVAIPVEYWSRPIVTDGVVTGAMATFIDITERKQAEKALHDSMERTLSLLNSMAEGAYGVDTHGNCTFVNRAFLQILGYQNADEVLGKHIHELIHHPRSDGSPYPASECKVYRAYETHQPINVSDEMFWRKDGVAIPVEYWSYPIVKDGVVTGAIITFIDITERKHQQALLAGEKHVLEMLARNAPLGEVLDALVRIYEEQYEGRKSGAILLLNADETHLRVGGAPSLPESFRRVIDGVITDPHGGSQEGRAREMVAVSDIASDPHCAVIRDEALYHGLCASWSTPIISAKGALLGAFAVYAHETSRPTAADRELLERARQLAGIAIEKYRDQESLATMAYYDALTGLPNRVLLQDRLHQAIIEANRHERLVALLFMDLDRFKSINDTLGHERGDLLLKKVAQRLQSCVRPGDTVARPGGDEFIVVLADVAHVDDVSRVTHKIIDVFSLPFEIGGRELFVTCSIGITLYPFDDRDIETLYRNADAAMYHAKDEGGNNFQFYSAEMNAQSFKHLVLENALRRAIERDELRLHYQPQVDLHSGRMVGAEALVRWQHPELGLVSPADFILLAEETGLIVPIGEWVLRQACAQARAWQDAGLPPLRVAVNLSARQFRQKNLLDVITTALQHVDLEPKWLEVEVTESLVMGDVNRAIDVLRGLERMGVSVAMDDFGTGYCSLSYLRRLPIDVIKIDRSFIEHIPDNPDDVAIATAIIALAKSLQLTVVAEGVETQAQLNFLRQHGCDTAQGYYYSRPLPPEDFVRFLGPGPLQPD